MFCQNCGAEIPDDAAFCSKCGEKIVLADEEAEAAAEIVPAEPETSAVEKPARKKKAKEEPRVYQAEKRGNIMFCEDGKYRWYYEYKMLKNPTILFTVLKVLYLGSLAPALLTFFLQLGDGFITACKVFFEVFLICAAIMTVLGIIGYVVLAGIFGWTYMVLFEMDEEGVTHLQMAKQYKKAQAVSWLAALAGAVTGNLTLTGAGLLAASRNSMSSEFSKVKSLKKAKGRNTIYVNELLGKNQVYCAKEDYDFVWDYISSRCPNAKIK